MTSLVIPGKREIIPPGFADQIRADVAVILDLEVVEKGRRKIMALRAWSTNKEHKKQCEAAERWCEIRIGELDPAPSPKESGSKGGRGKKASPAGEPFKEPPRNDKHKFRLLTKHKSFVSPLIEKGMTARRKLLAEIKRTETRKAASRLRVSLPKTCHLSSMEKFLPTLSGLDAIITDPPYPKKYLALYGELAKLSKAALREDGLLAVMCGQSHLPEILALMTPHITYRWTMAYLTPGGQAVQLWQRNVNTFWKPVLLFGGSGDWIGDVVQSAVNDNDKRFHGWGQSESGMLSVVEKLTRPDDLVCDPFLGAGTTGVVCAVSGRRFVGCDIDEKCVKDAEARIALASQAKAG